MDITKETYNKIAQDWVATHQADSWWVGGMDFFIDALPAHARILDVGCGGGVKSKHLIQRGALVVGVDYSDAMIDIAREQIPEAEFHVGDMRNMDPSLGEFDGIFMQASLLHIRKQDVPDVLSGICKLLKSSGCLYITVKEQQSEMEEEIVTEGDDSSLQRLFSYFTMDELKAYMQNLQLSVCYEWQGDGWLQIIGKKG